MMPLYRKILRQKVKQFNENENFPNKLNDVCNIIVFVYIMICQYI